MNKIVYLHLIQFLVILTPISLVYARLFGAYMCLVPVGFTIVIVFLTWKLKGKCISVIYAFLYFVVFLGIFIYIYMNEAKEKREATLETTILQYHDIDLIKRKINQGYDVNSSGKSYTMLTAATQIWFPAGELMVDSYRISKLNRLIYEILKFLLENGAGATVNTLDKGEKKAPLHYVVFDPGLYPENKKRIVNMLFFYGANVNLPDGDGDTPLHLAVLLNDMEIADMLIKNGADVHIKNNEGKTPMDLAMADNYYNMVKYLEGVSVKSP